MFKKLIIAVMLGLPALAMASTKTLSSIINAFAIKQSESHTNNSWEDIQKIQNVKWQWKYYETGMHGDTMKGKTHLGKSKNPNIGKTFIEINGMRTMITGAEIRIENTSIRLEDFGSGKYQRIPTKCDIDGATMYFSTYEYTQKGYKPLYISQEGSWGIGGDGSESYYIAYNLNDILERCEKQ